MTTFTALATYVEGAKCVVFVIQGTEDVFKSSDALAVEYFRSIVRLLMTAAADASPWLLHDRAEVLRHRSGHADCLPSSRNQQIRRISTAISSSPGPTVDTLLTPRQIGHRPSTSDNVISTFKLQDPRPTFPSKTSKGGATISWSTRPLSSCVDASRRLSPSPGVFAWTTTRSFIRCSTRRSHTLRELSGCSLDCEGCDDAF